MKKTHQQWVSPEIQKTDCFSKPIAYITHNAAQPLSELFRLNSASSGTTKSFIFNLFHICSPTPDDLWTHFDV